jgi:hypothetical protein
MISEASWQLTLDMPREKAWGILRNLTQAHNYVPGIIDTKLTTEITEGVGASRNVYQSKTRYLQETVTEWNEGYGFKIRLHKGDKSSPFKNAFFRYELSGDGDKTCLKTTMGYTPPLGPLGAVLDSLLLNKIISGVIRDVAISMKHYYETGKPTKKQDLKRLKRTML